MNIKSISYSVNSYQNFGAKNKQEVRKPKLLERIISKAIVQTGTKSDNHVRVNQEPINNDTYINKEVQSDPAIKTIITHLNSGSVKTDKIKSDVLAGTFIESDFNPPVNGIAKIKTIKNASGDIAEIKTFDSDGQVLKDIIYNRDLNSYWYNAHKPQSIVITDEQGNITTIYNEFLNHKPSQIKTVTIKTPDGAVKKTVVPHSLSDKIKDKATDIQWKIKQSIN